MEALLKYFPEQALRNKSYLYEYASPWGATGICDVTIFDAGDEVFVVLTDAQDNLGPGVSANFTAIASALKAIDPLLEDLSAEKIHWIEYRGPGSYNARPAPSFLLVVMSFNPRLKRFIRASWGHIFNLADLVARSQSNNGGGLCQH